MRRREFIEIAATAAAGMALPASAAAHRPDRLTVLATPHLLDVLHDHRLIGALGARYRGTALRNDNVDTIIARLLADLDTARDHSLEQRVHERVRHDFAEGRTVKVNGWILAVTEARQCALYSLLHG